MTVGLCVALGPATSAGAAEVPVDSNGCPAGGNPGGALPCVTHALSCLEFGYALSLSNAAAAGANAEFEITTATGTTSLTVTPNDTQFRTVAVAEDTTVHVEVEETTTGQVFVDRDVTRDCTDPSATVGDFTCAESALVSVTNPGGTSGTSGVDFTVQVFRAGGSTPTASVTIGAVTGVASTVPTVTGDGSLRIVVTASTVNGTGNTPTTEVVADRTQAVDCDAPTITLTTPADGATYVRGQAVTVDFACADAGSGPSLCDGTNPDDGPLDTSIVGDHSFTVNSSDFGNHLSSVTHDFTVVPARCVGQDATVDLRFDEQPTAGDDVIIGTPGDDAIDGRGGDDVICGWGGDDDIQGGGGLDVVRGGRGRDQLFAGADGGRLDGGPGSDQVFGGPDNDSLKGGSGADALSGRAGNDLGDGGANRDTCDLGAGRDTYRNCEITTE